MLFRHRLPHRHHRGPPGVALSQSPTIAARISSGSACRMESAPVNARLIAPSWFTLPRRPVASWVMNVRGKTVRRALKLQPFPCSRQCATRHQHAGRGQNASLYQTHGQARQSRPSASHLTTSDSGAEQPGNPWDTANGPNSSSRIALARRLIGVVACRARAVIVAMAGRLSAGSWLCSCRDELK